MPFQDLIRTANEQGMLRGDWPAWRRYRDMRTRTSHTYAATVAAQVVAGIPDFLAEATYLARPVATAPAMTAALDLREDHADIVRGVLRAHLPQGARAYVFGSRAHGEARRYSDLDLALEWDRPLGLDVIGEIAEALSESDLPYKVDIVDLLTVDPAFRARIAADCMAFDTIEAGG